MIWERGEIAKILTSSTWVLITFPEEDTQQWVTSREVRSPPTPHLPTPTAVM